MPINLPIDDHAMSLRDAMAYEFYMDNLSAYMDGWKDKNTEEEHEDIGVALAKLARAAYTVAEIFCITRDDIISKSIESNDDNDA